LVNYATDTGTGGGLLTTTFPLTVGGSIIMPSINLVPAGTGPAAMIGNRIDIKSIALRGRVFKPPKLGSNNVDPAVAWSGQSLAAEEYRVALILDTQANGNSPGVLDVIQYQYTQTETGSIPVTINQTPTNLYSMLNMANIGRFKILKEWEGTLQGCPVFVGVPTAGGGGTNTYTAGWAAASRDIKWFKKTSIRIDTDGSVANTPNQARPLSSIRSNNLFVIGWSNNSNASVELNFRIRFWDS
jgi:hypothetical protein